MFFKAFQVVVTAILNQTRNRLWRYIARLKPLNFWYCVRYLLCFAVGHACNSNGHNSLFCRTYMYTTLQNNDKNIDMWMENGNQYSRTDLMQTNDCNYLTAIITFVCVQSSFEQIIKYIPSNATHISSNPLTTSLPQLRHFRGKPYRL